MAPKFAPKVWKRPYTSIYNDNYRYGNSLYSEAITDIEKKYNEAMASTRFRNDRPDIGLRSFADSQLTGELAARHSKTQTANENLSNEHLRSISLSRVNSYLEDSERKTHSALANSPSFDTYYSARQLDRVNNDLDESRSLRRSRSVRRPESSYYGRQSSYELLNGDTIGPRDTFWMERCTELQKEVEQLKLELNTIGEKVKHEQALSKTKINEEVSDLLISIDDQDRQINDLNKQLRKQAKQVSDISLELQASHRQYSDISDQLLASQKRCLHLVHEIEDMKVNLEKSNIYTSLAKEMSKIPPPQKHVPDHYNVKTDPRFAMLD